MLAHIMSYHEGNQFATPFSPHSFVANSSRNLFRIWDVIVHWSEYTVQQFNLYPHFGPPAKNRARIFFSRVFSLSVKHWDLAHDYRSSLC